VLYTQKSLVKSISAILPIYINRTGSLADSTPFPLIPIVKSWQKWH